MTDDYLERILTARVYDVAVETPLDPAPLLSRRLGNTLLLKREDLQPVFSFKIRGAYNKMSRLSRAQLRRGVIAASAGNHAQGVALSARHLGCKAVIVMPVTTPRIKVDAVAARGAKVVLSGDSYDEAGAHALALAREILQQHGGPLDAIFVAVGGGGLIAGVAAYVKRLRPEVRIVGVEPVDADSMARSLAAGQRVRLAQVGLFADGVAVRQPGEETFRLARRHVDEMVLVDNDAICAAIKDVFEETRVVLEPAGALAVAGAKAWVETHRARNRTLVAIACGANMNFDRLRFVAEQAEIGERREAVLAVTIPERPGSFRRFCQLIGRRNVTEFNYRFHDPAEAHVFVGLQVEGRAEVRALVRSLRAAGLEARDFSDNELAKLHVRHMVGGRSPEVEHEVLYRFQFPERPGALMQFLDAMSPGWNISLFHYRNHGADHGRVLAGVQVPPRDRGAFKRFLRELNYPHWDETGNPAAHLFL
jgi:threonine dehydratase